MRASAGFSRPSHRIAFVIFMPMIFVGMIMVMSVPVVMMPVVAAVVPVRVVMVVVAAANTAGNSVVPVIVPVITLAMIPRLYPFFHHRRLLRYRRGFFRRLLGAGLGVSRGCSPVRFRIGGCWLIGRICGLTCCCPGLCRLRLYSRRSSRRLRLSLRIRRRGLGFVGLSREAAGCKKKQQGRASERNKELFHVTHRLR